MSPSSRPSPGLTPPLDVGDGSMAKVGPPVVVLPRSSTSRSYEPGSGRRNPSGLADPPPRLLYRALTRGAPRKRHDARRGPYGPGHGRGVVLGVLGPSLRGGQVPVVAGPGGLEDPARPLHTVLVSVRGDEVTAAGLLVISCAK